MSQATPVMLAILLDLQSALQTITRATGYNNDVKATSVVLDPQDLTTVPTTEVPFFVLDIDPNGGGNNDFGPATTKPFQVKNDFTVQIRARVDAPGDDPSRKTILAWRLYADVEVALVKDVSRGGNCSYTYVGWPSFYPGLPSQVSVGIEIPVKFTLNRPYGLM